MFLGVKNKNYFTIDKEVERSFPANLREQYLGDEL